MMATNKIKPKSTHNRPHKSRAAPGSQVSAASNSNSKSRPLSNVLADKENAPPQQASQSSPFHSRQASTPLTGAQNPASSEGSTATAAILQRLEDMETRLQKAQEEKQELEAVVAALRAEGRDADTEDASEENIIPRPAGTPGKDWSVQIEMGLSGSPKKAGKYAALLRGLRDLVLNANIKWEDGWKEISAADKSRMFQVARKRFPILKQYANDWATAEIIKQYIKNKRAHHYNNGWLEVPEKYAYLKQNASKRDPTGSRVKRAKVESAAKKKAKRLESLAIRQRKNTAEKAGVGMDEEPESPDYGGSDLSLDE